MSDFRTYVTQTGFGLERDAKFNNTQVDLAVLVVGDGVLPDLASPAERTDLIHQVREYAITVEKDEKDPNVWVARAEIPASDGGFFIKEAGIKTTTGELYSYARQAGDYKPLLEEGQGKSYTIRLKFVPGNADAIQIKIDPSVQFVTPTDLGNAVKEHLEEDDPHSQYATVHDITGLKNYADARFARMNMMSVSGTADEIVLTSEVGVPPVTSLRDFDEFTFIVSATNTASVVTIKMNPSWNAGVLVGVVAPSQIFKTALLTVRHIGGVFYIVSQTNPKTGNNVLDIAKLYTDTVDISRSGEYALDGASYSRAAHPIAFSIISASSNYMDQATKDANPIDYGGYYGSGDGSTTFTLPMVGGEFIRMFDDGRGVDNGRAFGSYKIPSHIQVDDDGLDVIGAISQSQNNIGGHGLEESQVALTNLHYNSATTTDTMVDGFYFLKSVRPRSIAYFGKTRL
jgi:phage-related tail fiber protein